MIATLRRATPALGVALLLGMVVSCSDDSSNEDNGVIVLTVGEPSRIIDVDAHAEPLPYYEDLLAELDDADPAAFLGGSIADVYDRMGDPL